MEGGSQVSHSIQTSLMLSPNEQKQHSSAGKYVKGQQKREVDVRGRKSGGPLVDRDWGRVLSFDIGTNIRVGGGLGKPRHDV